MIEFEQWLIDASVSKLVIVGHSQYLKKMFKLKSLMRNCDVWQSTVTISPLPAQCTRSVGRCQWGEPTLLHRTELAEPHPIDALFKGSVAKKQNHNPYGVHNSSSDASDANDNGDLDDNRPEESSCRICQVRDERRSRI